MAENSEAENAENFVGVAYLQKVEAMKPWKRGSFRTQEFSKTWYYNPFFLNVRIENKAGILVSKSTFWKTVDSVLPVVV